MNVPPPMKDCKGCPYNLGDPITGLCATCNPNHRWWKKSTDKKLEECVNQLNTLRLNEERKTDSNTLQT